MPEEIAVVDAGATAELAHRVAQARLDQRVHHYCRTAASGRDGQLEIVDGFDPWVPDLGEHLLRELGLEGEHQASRGLPRRVRDDVQLNGGVGGLVDRHAREGIPVRLAVEVRVGRG